MKDETHIAIVESGTRIGKALSDAILAGYANRTVEGRKTFMEEIKTTISRRGNRHFIGPLVDPRLNLDNVCKNRIQFDLITSACVDEMKRRNALPAGV